MSLDPNLKTKEAKWKILVDEFGKKTDKIGAPIDKGILETVIALNAFFIPTSASCEGHLNWSIAAPWIDIEPEKTEAIDKLQGEMKKKWNEAKTKEKKGSPMSEIGRVLEKYHEIEAEIKRPTLLLTQKVLLLLNKFYNDKSTPVDPRLVVRSIGLYTVRLESQGSIVQEIREPEERKNKLEEYQKEISLFTEFLKKKFFGT